MNQKNHVRRAALALAGALTLGVLSGCGGAPAKAPQTPDAGESAGYDPVTLDNYGREITISRRPERVLTLGPNCTELFAALGLSDLVVGRSLINHSRGPLPEYADAVNAVPELNYASATREAILSSGADFIYALDWEISDQGCNLEEAAQYGMNVYVNAASTLDQQYQEIRDLGAIFGVEETAEAFVADQQARIAAVQETLADR